MSVDLFNKINYLKGELAHVREQIAECDRLAGGEKELWRDASEEAGEPRSFFPTEYRAPQLQKHYWNL